MKNKLLYTIVIWILGTLLQACGTGAPSTSSGNDDKVVVDLASIVQPIAVCSAACSNCRSGCDQDYAGCMDDCDYGVRRPWWVDCEAECYDAHDSCQWSCNRGSCASVSTMDRAAAGGAVFSSLKAPNLKSVRFKDLCTDRQVATTTLIRSPYDEVTTGSKADSSSPSGYVVPELAAGQYKVQYSLSSSGSWFDLGNLNVITDSFSLPRRTSPFFVPRFPRRGSGDLIPGVMHQLDLYQNVEQPRWWYKVRLLCPSEDCGSAERFNGTEYELTDQAFKDDNDGVIDPSEADKLVETCPSTTCKRHSRLTVQLNYETNENAVMFKVHRDDGDEVFLGGWVAVNDGGPPTDGDVPHNPASQLNLTPPSLKGTDYSKSVTHWLVLTSQRTGKQIILYEGLRRASEDEDPVTPPPPDDPERPNPPVDSRGYSEGYNDGYSDGYDDGYDANSLGTSSTKSTPDGPPAYRVGYDKGYDDGFDAGWWDYEYEYEYGY